MYEAYTGNMLRSLVTQVFRRVKENFRRIEEFGWFSRSSRELPTMTFDVCPKEKDRQGLGYCQAAVLCLFSHYRGELQVLITQRSQLVRTNKGKANYRCVFG